MKNSKVQQCGSEPINKQMTTCDLIHRYEKARYDFNVTVEGYHFIKDPFNLYKIQPGHVIGWRGSGNISITNYSQDFGGDLGPMSSNKYSFHIKQYVSEVTETSYSTNFSPGKYSINARVIDSQDIRTELVNVMPYLETVKITTLSCDFGKNCSINAVSTPECIFNYFLNFLIAYEINQF